MPTFIYKGMNASGEISRSRLDTANAMDLEQRLKKMGVDLISCKETTSHHFNLGRRNVTRRDLINFCYHMEQMIRVGVPILDGLSDLRSSADNPRMRESVSALIASIEGGKTFSEALAEFPQIFDEIFVNLVRAGEYSGRLEEVLRKINESLKWQDELAAQTKKIVMYPAFVGTIVLGVIFFLMIYLVPRMVPFIQNMGQSIPLHTQVLIAVSGLCTSYWYLILIAPPASFALIKYLARVRPDVRYKLDEMKLRLWLVGPVLRKIILSRFASYFSLLYASGITVLNSLQISEAIAGNKMISAAINSVRLQIADGNSMSESFDNVNLFPPLVVRMIRLGESTGALDDALMNISYFYNRDVKEGIEKLQSMIEPGMTVVLGLILGWVMLSVLGPIYDVISKIRM